MIYRGHEMTLTNEGTTTVANGTTVIGCPSDEDAMAVIDGWESNAIDRMIAADALVYHRVRDLPSLLTLWDWEIDDHSPTGTRNIIAKLERACKAERRRAAHWSYQLNRHIALCAALKAEQIALANYEEAT